MKTRYNVKYKAWQKVDSHECGSLYYIPYSSTTPHPPPPMKLLELFPVNTDNIVGVHLLREYWPTPICYRLGYPTKQLANFPPLSFFLTCCLFYHPFILLFTI